MNEYIDRQTPVGSSGRYGCSQDWKEVESGRIVLRGEQVVADYRVSETKDKNFVKEESNFLRCRLRDSFLFRNSTTSDHLTKDTTKMAERFVISFKITSMPSILRQ